MEMKKKCNNAIIKWMKSISWHILDPVATIQNVGILETLGISLSCEDCHNCKTATFLVTEKCLENSWGQILNGAQQ